MRIGSRASWVVAWVCAVAGPVVFLVWDSDASWWVGLALLLPLIGMAAWRADQKGYDSDFADAGPFSPPP
jgi:hypothetical protein